MAIKTIKISRIRFALLALFMLAATILIFTDGNRIETGIHQGLLICGNIIIPSLFPFMVVLGFINKSGVSAVAGRILSPVCRVLFGLPGAAAATIALSFIGGYPVGTSGVNSLYKDGLITLRQARLMICFCVSAGPAFIVSAVGGVMFGSHRFGLMLFSVHIAVGLIFGIAAGFFGRIAGISAEQPPNSKPNSARMPLSDCFVMSAHDAVKGMMSVCGFVVLFSGICAMIEGLTINNDVKQLLCGIVEITLGCKGAGTSGNLPLAAFMLGFGGLSVIFQILSASGEARPTLKAILAIRLLHGGVSWALITLYLRVFRVSVPVFNFGRRAGFEFTSVSAPASVALILLCVAFLCTARSKSKERPHNAFNKNKPCQKVILDTTSAVLNTTLSDKIV